MKFECQAVDQVYRLSSVSSNAFSRSTIPLSSKLSTIQSSVVKKGSFSEVQISAFGDSSLAISKNPSGMPTIPSITSGAGFVL